MSRICLVNARAWKKFFEEVSGWSGRRGRAKKAVERLLGLS